MKTSRIAVTALVLALLTLACTASGAAGDPSDPFVSRDYVEGTFSDGVVKDAKNALAFTGEQLRTEAASREKGNTGSFTLHSISSGSIVKLGLGDSIVLLSGAANVEINSGALVNVSVGAEAVSGKLVKNHRYLACEDASATVYFSENASVALDGKPEIVGSSLPFTDVRPDDWFYGDVVNAVERGFVNGTSPTTFTPNGILTASECIKLAACMHQRHYTGAVTLANSPSGAWYDSYVEYALQNGILTEPFADYTTVLNRLQFVQIFYRALPVSCYGQINAIADDSIPDVTMTDTGAKEIYAFYRAGILTGLSQTAETAQYAFGAQKTITRAEVATILSRMVDTTTRRSFSIS